MAALRQVSCFALVALAACNGLTTDDHGPAASPASRVPSASCARPPATFSRGAYPANVEDVANAQYGLVGRIAQLHADIPACDTGSTADEDDTFQIDQIAWPAGDSGFVAPSMISTSGLPADASGRPMLVYGSGGTFGSGPGEGCTAVNVAALDLAQHPNAVSDMDRLRTFLADRATYDDLRAAAFVVDATVTSVGEPAYSNAQQEPVYTVSVLVTLQTNAVVCGVAGATFQAWNVQNSYGGGNPSGSGAAPAVGSRAIFVLRSDTVDGTLVIGGNVPVTDAARVSALLSTPPSLSL